MIPAQDLHKMANQLRVDVLQMVYKAQAGHVAGPLSSSEIVTSLYFGGIADLKNDKIVLSCGHYCPVLYSALARAGYFPVPELATFMQLGSRLPGHPEKNLTLGIEVSAGPLGQGVSVATGMALGMKMKYCESKVFCILSDGEIQEGQVWEAFNFSVHKKLDNLIFILDRNKIQIENYVSQLVDYGNLAGRMEAFGLHVIEIDGNNIEKMLQALSSAKRHLGTPTIVIANTVAGKGVSYMENKPLWHDKIPTKDELEHAISELQ